MDWGRWLGDVFKQHLFEEYLKKLEGRFQTADEVIRHYLRSGKDGNYLDPSFFEDLGIDDEKHRALFETWVQRQATRLDLPEPSPEEGFSPEKRQSLPRLPPVPGSVANEWLRRTDWSVGLLAKYRGALASACKHPDELADRYITQLPAGAGTRFDSVRFCQDFGVAEQDQWLFEAWFAASHGAAPLDETSVLTSGVTVRSHVRRIDMDEVHSSTSAAPVPEAPSTSSATPAPEAATSSAAAPLSRAASEPGPSASETLEFIEKTDWSLNILFCHYGDVLRENFDHPSQILDAYTSHSKFDHEQFFKDIGVEDEQHQKLFRLGIDAKIALRAS